ncbi:MAG: cupin domain-containing protein [Thermoleophilia bacterium]|nr:cupin domain-containing protein [Thermoleophilia bacterium]
MSDSKYGKYIITEDLMPPMPEAMVKAMEDQAREGKILDRTLLLGITSSIIPECPLFVGCEILWGLPGGKPVDIEIAHTHDFDEVIGFVGTNRNYPRELGGEIEILIGGERHTLTKTCLIFIPRGVTHCPVTLKRIDTPIVMFEACNDPNYRKNFAEGQA